MFKQSISRFNLARERLTLGAKAMEPGLRFLEMLTNGDDIKKKMARVL
jgi:hypothetical protein